MKKRNVTEKSVLNSQIVEDADIINIQEIIDEPDYEKQRKIEISRILKKKQTDQMSDMRDTKYFAVLVFGNEHDKMQFIDKLDKQISNEGNVFLDGYEFAKKELNIDIECTASLPEPYFAKALKIKNTRKNIKIKK